MEMICANLFALYDAQVDDTIVDWSASASPSICESACCLYSNLLCPLQLPSRTVEFSV